MTAAQIIADNLQALPHPDGTPRQMPGFNAQLLPEPMQQQVKQTAKDIGEAIINLLELNGYQILTQAELDQPTQGAEPAQVANVHCTMCDKKLFSLNLTNPAHSLTNGRMFLDAVAGLSPECPHQ